MRIAACGAFLVGLPKVGRGRLSQERFVCVFSMYVNVCCKFCARAHAGFLHAV